MAVEAVARIVVVEGGNIRPGMMVAVMRRGVMVMVMRLSHDLIAMHVRMVTTGVRMLKQRAARDRDGADEQHQGRRTEQ